MSKNKDIKNKLAQSPQSAIPPVWHGIFGAASGAIAMFIVQPMDITKTRMQIMGQQGKKLSILSTIRSIRQTSGIPGFWKGYSCAFFRQCTYGLTRFAVFYNLYEAYKVKYERNPTIPEKIVIGMAGGCLGGIAGNPAEVCLIRMTADGSKPKEQRYGYTNVINALSRIIKEEGPMTLMKGVHATATRCTIVTSAEIGSYVQFREWLLPIFGEGMPLHFVASMLAGLVSTTFSMPADMVKTRVQNMPGGSGSQIAIARDIIKKEGVTAFWSGFLPSYMKLGPHAVLQFVIFEQFYVLYWKIMTQEEDRIGFSGVQMERPMSSSGLM